MLNSPNFWSFFGSFIVVLLGSIGAAIKFGGIKQIVEDNEKRIKEISSENRKELNSIQQIVEGKTSKEQCQTLTQNIQSSIGVVFEKLEDMEKKRDAARADRSIELTRITSAVASISSSVNAFDVKLQAQSDLMNQQTAFTSQLLAAIKEGTVKELEHFEHRIKRIENKLNGSLK